MDRRSEIIHLIQQWNRQYGEPPKAKNWHGVRGTGWPSYVTVHRLFGSWDQAIAAAGFKPRGRGRPVK